MQRLIAYLLIALVAGVFLCLIGIPIIVSLTQRRRDRHRIMAEGKTADGVIMRVIPDHGSVLCRVLFSFQPEIADPRLECRQESTLAAVQTLDLREGSQVRVRFLPKWPRYAFIDSLVNAERLAAFKAATTGSAAPESTTPSIHYISYVDPKSGRAVPNTFRWSGDGDISIGNGLVRFTAQRVRPFWFPKVIQEGFPFDAVRNVEVFETAVRCELSAPHMKPRAVQFWTASPEEAKVIGAQLPDSKTSKFAPQLAEGAAFQASLFEDTPRAPVTPVLIGINVILFVIAAALGGGIVVPNGEVLIRLGSDYTPLTATGQWWRLLTSTFLHFGVLHLAFNMWALWVNGVIAERLYGSTRYLMLYLVAGAAGNVASFLWHPFVNGAGASGAIFGVLGAVFAYFLRTDSGVPNSVVVAQRRNSAIFIVISILNAARIRGIDNAAHLGGLAAGFIMGWLLRRPLDTKRNEQDWSRQWARALTVVVGSVLLVGYYLGSGQWHPRVVRDASGRPILFAELVPPAHTFDGITLGMTSAELLHAKGAPVREDPSRWIYNSIDSAHDGLVEAYFKDSPNGSPATVWAVLYWGKREAEPAGMADLLAFTRQDLIARYGKPRSDYDSDQDASYLYFQNGLIVELEADKVKAYGVYIPQQ